METQVPLCPVTGEPAVRRVQWVTTKLLTDLWRIEFGIDVRDAFAGLDRFGLWESPTGLYFFDPMRAGDGAFYGAFYGHRMKRWLFAENSQREEFRAAARRIPKGARVLDVGCGFGEFRKCVPDADYTGLDPHFAGESRIEGVRGETLAQHLLTHAGAYDAVCSFEVLEHLSDPSAMFADIVRATKPGGRIFIGVPHTPSLLTRIPNNLVNAPPHHLTWWTPAALSALAERAGVTVETVEHVPWAGEEALFYWMGRCSPIKCEDVHYRGAVSWHLSALTGFLAGVAAYRLFGAPRRTTDEGAALLLVARKPA